jgi:SAM-dependent methyltransferase
MSNPGDAHQYGDSVGGRYDDLYEGILDTAGAVDFLSSLAAEGPVLELGIGTGRLALPMRARGLTVHGIDSSPAMIAELRAKPGGGGIDVAVGDFSRVSGPGGPYCLAFVAFNTIFALADTPAQIACFQRVADQLVAGGRFVVEAFVLDACDYRHGEAIKVRAMTAARVELQLGRYAPDTQILERVFVNIMDGQVTLHSANDAYASPRELDLMAAMAGLSLDQRWQDWHQTPFTATSAQHVSVYSKQQP